MSYVGSRHDEFWMSSYPRSFVETTVVRFKDGSTRSSQYAFDANEHTCSRANKTKNLPEIILGTSTKFRSPSSYSREVVDISHHSGVWHTQNHWHPDVASVEVTGCANPLAANTQFRLLPCWEGGHQVTYDTNLGMMARVQAQLKLGAGKAQLGAALAESKKTLNMIADRSVDLLTALIAVKRGNKIPDLRYTGAIRRDSKRLADGFLEVKFGWLPLMGDIYGSYMLLQEQLKPAMLLMGQATIPDEISMNNGSPNPRYLTTGYARRWHRCCLWAQVDIAALRTANQAGLLNPLSIGWEVVPYSFLVDWFMPIGKVLEAHSARAGLTFVGGYEAVRSEGEAQATLKPDSGYTETVPRRSNAKHFGYRRWKLSGWPTLGAYADPTPFKSQRAATAVALFRQLLG